MTGPDLTAVQVEIHTRGELTRSVSARDPRFAEHLQLPLQADDGDTSYVVAWMNGIPVGHLNLRWRGSDNPQVQTHITDAPELCQLSVWPADLRSRGIGTNLIRAAHTAISGRGFRRVGLGVEIANTRARSLYERLDYADWGHGPYRDRWIEELDDGRTIAHEEPCVYLVKNLTAQPARAARAASL